MKNYSNGSNNCHKIVKLREMFFSALYFSFLDFNFGCTINSMISPKMFALEYNCYNSAYFDELTHVNKTGLRWQFCSLFVCNTHIYTAPFTLYAWNALAVWAFFMWICQISRSKISFPIQKNLLLSFVGFWKGYIVYLCDLRDILPWSIFTRRN